MTGFLIFLCDVATVLGVLGIVAGLALLVTTSPTREDHRR